MNKVLVITFLVLLYFVTVMAIKCLQCRNVAYDNTCIYAEKTCATGLWKFCYTRLITKGTAMIGVDRGCIRVCRGERKTYKDLEAKMLCCVADFCNAHNFWTNQ